MEPLALDPPRCVWPAQATLGEGPVWVGDALWFVDIKGCKALRLRPSDGARDAWPLPETIGCLVPAPDGDGFLAALKSRIVRLRFATPGVEPAIVTLTEPLADAPDYRFNDGGLDPDGAFWVGSMHDPETEAGGAWFRWTAHAGVERLVDGFRVTNGPAFDRARGRVLLTDSAERTIYQTAWPSHRPLTLKPWRRFDPEHGYPDGMCVDREGGLWVAFWDGACVRRLAPDGRIVQEIALPAPRPTSVAWGGAAGRTLYITSARVGLGYDALARSPLSGGVFACDMAQS